MVSTADIVNQTITHLIANPPPAVLALDTGPPLYPTDYAIDNLTKLYGPKRDPLFVVIPITFIYIIIFVTGVIGNISTCIVIARNRSMHTATNYYLFSLAISDLCLLMSGAPQEVYQMWSKYPYIFGEWFCVLRGLMAETSANATVLTITSFTVERYLAICHPFLQHTMSKLSRAIRLILIVWVVSLLLALPMALQFGVFTSAHGVAICGMKRVIITHSFELSTVLIFLTPMTIITILYILIGLKLRSSCLMKQENGTSLQRQAHMNSCRQQNSLGTRRVIKMLVAVVVAFFFCWAPFHIQRLVAFYGNDQPLLYAIVTYTSGILYYLSTCINPLLYNLMSNKFREAFKETLAKCCQLSKRRYNKKRAYRVLSRGQHRRNTTQESADYSGSSFRDESLYSTSTQKQSFDSMTLSRTQSVKISTHGHLKTGPHSSEPLFKTASTDKDHIHGSLLLTAMRNSRNSIERHVMRDVYSPNDGINNMLDPTSATDTIPTTTTTGASPLRTNNPLHHQNSTEPNENADSLPSSTIAGECINVKYKRKEEITISIGPNQNPAENSSRLLRFIRGIFYWRSNRPQPAGGYYSSTRNGTDGKNGVRGSNNTGKRCRSPLSRADAISIDDDDGDISNSSLKDVDTDALKDELSSYMEELRNRERNERN